MARTLGLPAAGATRLRLRGTVAVTLVRSPSTKEIDLTDVKDGASFTLDNLKLMLRDGGAERAGGMQRKTFVAYSPEFPGAVSRVEVLSEGHGESGTMNGEPTFSVESGSQKVRVRVTYYPDAGR